MKLYKEKQLEWEKEEGLWTSETPLGTYYAWRNKSGAYMGFEGETAFKHTTLEEAKAAAQKHYAEKWQSGGVEVDCIWGNCVKKS